MHANIRSRTTRLLVAPLATLALTLAAGSASALELTPFSASYAADMKNIPVNGEAVHSLQQNADGSWHLSFSASMFVARLTEESSLQVVDEQIRPLSYHYERRGLGRGKEITQQFDWQQGQVTGEYKDGEKHGIEKVGTRLRSMMPWMQKRTVKGAQAAY